MTVLRMLIAIALVAVAATLVPVAAAESVSQSPAKGRISWEPERIYWPSVDAPKYWISYPSVNIEEICPGASNGFRMTIGNMGEKELNFVILVQSSVTSDKSYDALPSDWVKITETSSDDSKEIEPADLVTIASADELGEESGITHVWVRVDIPEKKKYEGRDYQCRIKVMEASDNSGPDSVVSVSTADHLAGAGTKSTPFIFGTILVVILAGGIAVYAFSRWRWPDKPRQKKIEKEKSSFYNGDLVAPGESSVALNSGSTAGEGLRGGGTPPRGASQDEPSAPRQYGEGFSTGLSPSDWQ